MSGNSLWRSRAGKQGWRWVWIGLLVMGRATLGAAEPVLIWADEFETEGAPDAGRWLQDVGGGGWGNAEEQYYTEARLENARVEGGRLIIEARQEQWLANPNLQIYNDYTSARLVSKGSGDLLYGRVEVRAKLPAGRGTWPAIWMLPTGKAYGEWPKSGEIDIMEHVGHDMGTVHGSLHFNSRNWTTGDNPTASVVVEGVDTSFHDYVMDWTPEGIRFLVDGTELLYEPNPGTGWEDWPYDQPFYLILNLAVGGFWGGAEGIDPDIWPQRMEVEYVRVYNLGSTLNLDSDRDGIPNLTDPDDDNDGLTDVEEHRYGTNILKKDTDGDSYDDAFEILAGSDPLSSGSIPGGDDVLLINPDFKLGTPPWIVHTNKFETDGTWLGQAGSWGGAYLVSDYVTMNPDETLNFTSYAGTDAPYAEHLLYQEWKPADLGLVPGDVIRFYGTASSVKTSGDVVAEAFIRVLDFQYKKLPASTAVAIGPDALPFDLLSVIEVGNINVVQVGFLFTRTSPDAGTITFSGLDMTLNESPMWGSWPVPVNNIIDTGPWMGFLNVEFQPWVWSYSLSSWIYLPEEFISSSGSWMYIYN